MFYVFSFQDHFNAEKKEDKIEKEQANQPALDLKLKEGQTISINLGGKLKKPNQTSRPKVQSNSGGGGGLLLPPPPGGARTIAGPPRAAPIQQQQAPQSNNLFDQGQSSGQNTDWSDFSSASDPPKNTSNTNWIQF